ncbi:hypothetical protein RIF29_15727 [Crotalaria pallida]|uniref:At1g61320/AtMIF1 LRR domain-containing protein n=1 Tax=Crotalaria pallida TaxID=3830 RepID=A0AAN9IJB4_CROPI
MFLNHVESSLNRFFLHQQSLRKFDLTFFIYDHQEFEQDFGRVDNWLECVINYGVACLSLHVMSWAGLYPLPPYALSSKMLKELCLCGSIWVDNGIDINLPALKVLSICDVIPFNEGLSERLFSGCPFVEDLRIKDCKNMFHLQASSLSRLVELSISSWECLTSIEIGSPEFQSFSFSGFSSSYPCHVTLLGASKTLRRLKLDSTANYGHDLNLFYLLPTFTQLEDLFLEYVNWSEPIKISSQSLKRLVIKGLQGIVEVLIECPNLLALDYISNEWPFYSLGPLNPKYFRVELQIHHQFHHATWLNALKTLLENGFSFAMSPKVFIVLKDHKEAIILDMDSGLIESMLSFLYRVEDLESTSIITIASSFGNLNEILTPIPPHMAFNIVSPCTSNFTQVFSEKLAKTLESCGCIVEKDTAITNFPLQLRRLPSSYQITRIVSKWDWAI